MHKNIAKTWFTKWALLGVRRPQIKKIRTPFDSESFFTSDRVGEIVVSRNPAEKVTSTFGGFSIS